LTTAIEQLISGFKGDLKDMADFDKIKKATKVLEKELKGDYDADAMAKLALVLEANKQFKEITKPYAARMKDNSILQAKLDSLDNLLVQIGGQISTEESQKLILKKHFDIINDQLQRYLNAEKRALIAAYENLFDKYYTSAQAVEQKRETTMADLNEFLTQLNYLN